MSKPVLLDLFCRAGGATVGYQRAGFYVIGVDIEEQSEYPGDEFHCADALKVLSALAADFAIWRPWHPVLIHASPPCQDGNTATASNRARGRVDSHVQLVPPTRALLDRVGIPYLIEQPTMSRRDIIRRDLTLCMDMFRGDMLPPWVQKHRSFELSGFTVPQPPHRPHAGYVRGWRHGIRRDGPYVAAYGKGGGKGTVAEIQHAQQMHWVTDHFDLCEAIPPAYTEHIGRAFLAQSLTQQGRLTEVGTHG